MVNIHQGSWFGLPDFGITEMLTGNKTGQGGSDIIPNLPKPGQPTNDPKLNSVYTNPSYGSPSSGQIQGAMTGTSNTSGGFIGPPAPTNNNSGNRGGNSSPSDADYDALGVARGDVGGLERVRREQEQNRQNEINQQIIREQEQNRELDALYSETLGALDSSGNRIREGFATDESNLNSKIDLNLGKFGTEEKNLIGDIGDQQTQFNKTLETAYQQAVRAFNALSQQGRARFGLGGSAGRAVGELANQEFARQQGNIGEKQVSGALDFQKQVTRVKEYVRSKTDDLEQYRKEAVAELKKNMEDRLTEIDMKKADTMANKSRDKMAIMRETQTRMQYLSDQDKQFRQGLAMAALTNMQEIAGRAFTPKEIKATLAEFGAGIPDLSYQAPTVQYNTAYKPSDQNDEFKSLSPFG